MKTYGAWREVRGRQIGCSFARERPKKIHNPLFYVVEHCAYVCGRMWTHARPRVRVCVSRPRYSSGLYVRARMHTYRSLVRALVCVYTRPSPCTRVSGSVSSSRVAFRASISVFPPRFSLIFCKTCHYFFIFFFLPAAKVNPRWLPHGFFVCPSPLIFLPSIHPLTLPLLLYPFLFFFFVCPTIYFLLLSLSLSLSVLFCCRCLLSIACLRFGRIDLFREHVTASCRKRSDFGTHPSRRGISPRQLENARRVSLMD